MSLLEKLCKELGVEVGEPWLGDTGKRYVINEYGQVRVWSDEYDEWIEPYYNLGHIINGELKPVWEPKSHEKYYVPSVFAPEKYLHSIWQYTPRDELMYERGIIFKTREEAIEMTNKMLKLAKEEI